MPYRLSCRHSTQDFSYCWLEYTNQINGNWCFPFTYKAGILWADVLQISLQCSKPSAWYPAHSFYLFSSKPLLTSFSVHDCGYKAACHRTIPLSSVSWCQSHDCPGFLMPNVFNNPCLVDVHSCQSHWIQQCLSKVARQYANTVVKTYDNYSNTFSTQQTGSTSISFIR